MSQLHEMKTSPVAPTLPPRMEASPRKGTHTKTMAKTARACGSNYTPTKGWRDRKVGEGGKEYQKRVANRLKETIKANSKGDKVTI